MNDFVPEWAKHAVWYQIFPERFWNGDRANDPRLEDISVAWPNDTKSPWHTHPWTSGWYSLQPYEQGNGHDFWYNVSRRRYGGDIQGILDRLDYLSDLGVTAIYLNPVFDAPSSHKYDGSSYHHIDPNFGPDPAGDRKLIAAETPDDPKTWHWTAADKLMLRLIREVHDRGMRIIFDGVFNHMGLGSWAFSDVMRRQRESKYREWFKVKSWDDPAAGTKFDWQGWFNVRSLPELNQNEHGIVDGPKQYIFAATRRWMDPARDGDVTKGIDGWRLDVAVCIKHSFWKEWRLLVKSINPEAYIVAEIVDSVAANEPYLQGDEFDAVMNYNFAFACSEFFIQRRDRITVTQFDRLLRELREAYPLCVANVMQNLFGSHDTARIGSQIVNCDFHPYRDWNEYHRASQARHDGFQTRKPTAAELRVQKLFAIFQMTYLGAPMIYYGDEAGMWGANDPCCRKPMLWAELKYEPEHGEPVEFNHDLFAHYKKLIAIRNAAPTLQLGTIKTLLTNDEAGIFAFVRQHDHREAMVILNNSETVRQVKLPVQGVFADLLNGERNLGSSFEVKPLWGRILQPV